VAINEAATAAFEPQQETTMRTAANSSLFLIGKNRRGNWVAQSQHGLRGGLFISRAEALKFALFENGNRPELVITVPGVFDLDLSSAAFAARPSAVAEAAAQRLAA
jgi:hypothetical protein